MPTGTQSTYDLNVGTKVNMDEAIYMLSPLDTPMLNGVDADGLSVISSLPTDQVRVDFMQDQILTPRTTLGGAATTGDTFITLPSAADQIRFSTGDILRITKAGVTSPEVVQVTGYGTTAATLLVNRSYEGTTATNYVSGATVIGIGSVLAEGSNPEAARARDRDTYFNLTQIFGPTSVDITGTELVISKYGVASEYAHQLWARTHEQGIMREAAYVYGQRTNSTTTKKRSMGGLDYYIQTQVENTATQLTIASITTQQQAGFNRGGVFDRVMANPLSLADLNLVEDFNRVRQTFDDPRRGRVPVMQVSTEFGLALVVRNRWVDKMHAFAFSRENVVRRPLRPVTVEMLAKTGDSQRTMLVCEESIEIKGQEHCAKWVNLTAY